MPRRFKSWRGLERIFSLYAPTHLDIIDSQMKKGAEGIVLGCTEIPLLIKQKDVSAPLFDTTEIHARAAVELALT